MPLKVLKQNIGSAAVSGEFCACPASPYSLALAPPFSVGSVHQIDRMHRLSKPSWPGPAHRHDFPRSSADPPHPGCLSLGYFLRHLALAEVSAK